MTATTADIIAIIADNEALTCSAVCRDANLLADHGINPDKVTDATAGLAHRALRRMVDATLARVAPKQDDVEQDDVEFKAPVNRRATVGRFKVLGRSAASVIRWMGKAGWNFEDAGVALATLGAAKISDTTIRCQLIAGKKGERGGAPELTRGEIRTLEDARN